MAFLRLFGYPEKRDIASVFIKISQKNRRLVETEGESRSKRFIFRLDCAKKNIPQLNYTLYLSPNKDIYTTEKTMNYHIYSQQKPVVVESDCCLA